MIRRVLLAAPAALALALVWGPAPAAGAGESFDPRLEEMLRRAATDEDPTADDRRAAARALRDWRLSEERGPRGDRRVEELLRALAGGQRVSAELGRLAEDLRRDYLTDAGCERRMREEGSRHPYLAGGGAFDPGGPPREAGTEGDWFLFLACATVFGGGLVVWAITRKGRRPDGRLYYQ